MKKVVLLESLGIPQAELEALQKPFEGEVAFAAYPRTADVEQLKSKVRDADALILANMPLPGEVIRAAERLQFIDVAFTGVDHVALDAARERGIRVSNASGYSNEAVAELVIGMAGVSNRHATAFVEQTVRDAGFRGHLQFLGDQEIALAGAISGHGAVLIAGTGSVCCGRDQSGTLFRVGGYGYLIDDPGSGYAIGRDILTAVVRAVDGRGRATCLKDLVFRELKTDEVRGLITWLYAPATGKKEVAAITRLLPEALKAGDEAALAIAEKATEDLADIVLAGWKKTGMEDGELALTGSILEHFDGIREGMAQRVHAVFPNIEIGFPRSDPAHGAASLACKALKHSDILGIQRNTEK